MAWRDIMKHDILQLLDGLPLLSPLRHVTSFDRASYAFISWLKNNKAQIVAQLDARDSVQHYYYLLWRFEQYLQDTKLVWAPIAYYDLQKDSFDADVHKRAKEVKHVIKNIAGCYQAWIDDMSGVMSEDMMSSAAIGMTLVRPSTVSMRVGEYQQYCQWLRAQLMIVDGNFQVSSTSPDYQAFQADPFELSQFNARREKINMNYINKAFEIGAPYVNTKISNPNPETLATAYKLCPLMHYAPIETCASYPQPGHLLAANKALFKHALDAVDSNGVTLVKPRMSASITESWCDYARLSRALKVGRSKVHNNSVLAFVNNCYLYYRLQIYLFSPLMGPHSESKIQGALRRLYLEMTHDYFNDKTRRAAYAEVIVALLEPVTLAYDCLILNDYDFATTLEPKLDDDVLSMLAASSATGMVIPAVQASKSRKKKTVSFAAGLDYLPCLQDILVLCGEPQHLITAASLTVPRLKLFDALIIHQVAVVKVLYQSLSQLGYQITADDLLPVIIQLFRSELLERGALRDGVRYQGFQSVVPLYLQEHANFLQCQDIIMRAEECTCAHPPAAHFADQFMRQQLTGEDQYLGDVIGLALLHSVREVHILLNPHCSDQQCQAIARVLSTEKEQLEQARLDVMLQTPGSIAKSDASVKKQLKLDTAARHQQRISAVTQLQAAWRGYQGRRSASALRQQQLQQRGVAASKIQLAWRAYQQRRLQQLQQQVALYPKAWRDFKNGQM